MSLERRGEVMGFKAEIILDSIHNGSRLTTMEVTYPRIILAEMNTHRMFSRNTASSRAIPIKKMIQRVSDDPFIPIYWGKNQPGMQASEELNEIDRSYCREVWIEDMNSAVASASLMSERGAHKQIVNRLLEPWMWVTQIITATEWTNFFSLRCHPDAQPEMQHIARMMEKLYRDNKPMPRKRHLPYVMLSDQADEGMHDEPVLHVEPELLELSAKDLFKISVARCARV